MLGLDPVVSLHFHAAIVSDSTSTHAWSSLLNKLCARWVELVLAKLIKLCSELCSGLVCPIRKIAVKIKNLKL